MFSDDFRGNRSQLWIDHSLNDHDSTDLFTPISTIKFLRRFLKTMHFNLQFHMLVSTFYDFALTNIAFNIALPLL